MQEFLRQHPNAPVRVFAVWEPVLFVDWQRPTTAALARLSDPRVRQLWDHDHVLANEIAAAQGRPTCCEAKNILFDLVAVYPPGETWSNHPPATRVFDGPIFKVVSEIEGVISKS